MGLFRLSKDQKAAGIKPSTSFIDRAHMMKTYFENLSTLTDSQRKQLKKLRPTIDGFDKREANIVTLNTLGCRATAEESARLAKNLCPFCGSDNIKLINGGRKIFSADRAIIGAAISGPGGMMAGAFGGKRNKNVWVCEHCGRQFVRDPKRLVISSGSGNDSTQRTKIVQLETQIDDANDAAMLFNKLATQNLGEIKEIRYIDKKSGQEHIFASLDEAHAFAHKADKSEKSFSA